MFAILVGVFMVIILAFTVAAVLIPFIRRQ
jgi:hypothetical protein